MCRADDESTPSWRLIKDEIDALGLSVAKAAEGLGVTRQQLYRVINGESGISPEMAVRQQRGIGSSAEAWLKMQMNYDLAQIQKHAASIPVKRLKPKEERSCITEMRAITPSRIKF